MKTFNSLLAASLLASASSLALADLYAGVDYSFIEAEEVDLGAVAFKGGYQINDWAAVEARVGFGVDDDRIGGVKAELNNVYGAYFVAGLPNDTIVFPYIIGGYTRGEIEVAFGGSSTKADDSDFSFGFGARLDMTDRLSANLEFMRYAETNDIEFDGVNLGVIFKF